MSDIEIIHMTMKFENSSENIFEVFLEWDLPLRYVIAPRSAFVVHVKTTDIRVLQTDDFEWQISVSLFPGGLSIYMPGEILLAREFYLTDFATSEVIEPVEGN